MKKAFRAGALILTLAWSRVSMAVISATVQRADSPMWASPSVASSLMGVLKLGTWIYVLSKTPDGRYFRIEVSKVSGQRVRGYVNAKDVRIEEVSIDANEQKLRELRQRALEAEKAREEAQVADAAPQGAGSGEGEGKEAPGLSPGGGEKGSVPAQTVDQSWAIGAGFSGTSTAGVTTATVSADVRYLWSNWFESLLGLDLTFGNGTEFGGSQAERLYAPLGFFRPYVHGGYLINDVRDYRTGAWEVGGGLQFIFGGGTSFFEAGAVYMIRTPFNAAAQNSLTFGGTSGVRF